MSQVTEVRRGMERKSENGCVIHFILYELSRRARVASEATPLEIAKCRAPEAAILDQGVDRQNDVQSCL